MADAPRFRRIHDSGTEAIITQYADAWHIRIDLKEAAHSAMTIVGFLTSTVEQAKKLADQEVFKHGHVCTAQTLEKGLTVDVKTIGLLEVLHRL